MAAIMTLVTGWTGVTFTGRLCVWGRWEGGVEGREKGMKRGKRKSVKTEKLRLNGSYQNRADWRMSQKGVTDSGLNGQRKQETQSRCSHGSQTEALRPPEVSATSSHGTAGRQRPERLDEVVVSRSGSLTTPTSRRSLKVKIISACLGLFVIL